MTHKILSVIPMKDYILGIKFTEGAVKLYDMNPLFDEHPQFSVLKNNIALYSQVSVDVCGYGISWNDDLDLSADELWEHGWPEWNEEELVTIEIEIDEELLRKVEEVLKPYGLTPEDWAVMALELLVFSPTQQKAMSLLIDSVPAPQEQHQRKSITD